MATGPMGQLQRHCGVLLLTYIATCNSHAVVRASYGTHDNSTVPLHAVDGATPHAGEPPLGAPGSVAVAYIAMYHAAGEAIFAHSVWTARVHGRWTGPIYVITDQPRCAPPGTVVVRSLRVKELNAPTMTSHYKQHKMALLRLLPRSVEVVLYLDIDILITAPLQPLLAYRHLLWEPFMATAAGGAAEQQHASQMLMFPEMDADVGAEKWHGGVIMMRRDRSELCLQQWERVLIRNAALRSSRRFTGVRDQSALAQMLAGQRGAAHSRCVVTSLPYEDHFVLPDADRVKARGPWRTLVHVTRTGRLKGRKGEMTPRLLQCLGEQLLDIPASANATSRNTRAVSELDAGASRESLHRYKHKYWWKQGNPECKRYGHHHRRSRSRRRVKPKSSNAERRADHYAGG